MSQSSINIKIDKKLKQQFDEFCKSGRLIEHDLIEVEDE